MRYRRLALSGHPDDGLAHLAERDLPHRGLLFLLGEERFEVPLDDSPARAAAFYGFQVNAMLAGERANPRRRQRFPLSLPSPMAHCSLKSNGLPGEGLGEGPLGR